MMKINNIILPTDFSKISLKAFSYAEDFAVKYEAEIYLVHVIDPASPFFEFSFTEESKEELLKKYEIEVLNNLKSLKSGFEVISTKRIKTKILYGTDFKEIVNLADSLDNSCIVISTHGRTGTLQNIMGSVTEKVIRNSSKPVFVIPSN